VRKQQGQSLIEVIVAIGIAAVFLGAGVTAIAPIIKTNLETRTIQFADSLAQDYSNKLQNLSESSWTSLYNLSKGSGNNYMLIASGTQTLVVVGQESSPDGDVVSGLVGHWKFDEATSTQAYDFSGNGNGGTLTNGPTRTASSSCKLGNCLSFDGDNDYVMVGDPASGTLDPTSEYSLSAWLKYTITTSYGFIISKSNGGLGGGYELFRKTGSGAIRFSSCDAAGSCSGGYFDIFTPLSYNDGSWHHITATAETNSTAKIYVDGTLVEESGTITQDNIANAFNLFIGARSTGGSVPFNGSIDDVRVYNRALSAAEVKQLYSNRIYTRSFTVDNVSRDSCGVGSISTEATSTCSSGPGTAGVADDPSTQKITINVNWSGGGSVGSAMSKIQYLARTASSIFRQTSWSGGSGQEGPISTSTNQYATSTSIDISSSTGSIIIQGY
jgi:type II secretory pathway pseudopilin PulG